MKAQKFMGVVAAGVLMVGVAGCGDSKSSSATDDGTTTSMHGSGMDMSGTTGSTAAAQSSTTAVANASVVEVPIENFAFNPTTLTIKAGTTVKWTNKDSATHTVTSGANRTADKKFDQSLQQGKSFEYTFTTAGEYDYFCKPHENMNAKIIVQ